jgi:2'-5' RNA ligase
MSELPPHLRAFVAVRVPDDVIAQVTAFQQQLKPEFRSVSWTRPAAMHLTLQFLGNIPSTCLPALTEGLELVATRHRSFSLALGGANAASRHRGFRRDPRNDPRNAGATLIASCSCHGG